MPDDFRSERHKRVFHAVLNGVEALSYRGRLCQRDYEFADWFGGQESRIVAAAAAFAREPADYDSACLAVFLQGGGPPLRYRSLGAPFGIEVGEDGIVPWCIGRNETSTRAPVGHVPADALDRFFASVGKKWSRDEVLRAKNIGKVTGPFELDWVDTGLIPAPRCGWRISSQRRQPFWRSFRR